MKKIFNQLFAKKMYYSDSMFSGEFGETQKELAELAISIGKKDYRVNLDFSIESIQLVDDILADVHGRYKNDSNESSLFGVALEFGAYIAATIQKELSLGVMYKSHPTIGENTFPFMCNELSIFPCGWCEKRIHDGPSDNVESKFLVFLSKLNK